MNKKSLLKHLVLLMFFIFILNLLAGKFYWYYSIWYFDIFMHFWSGFWVSLFFLYVFYDRDIFSEKFSAVILCVLFIGVSWEIFEFVVNNNIGKELFSFSDTFADLIFDLLGGIAAIFFFSKKIMIDKENTI